MAERSEDLDLGHLFRVIFLQGGQVAIGTAIGAGVLLLVGIVGILLSPILVPVFLYRYWRHTRTKENVAPIPDGRPTSDARRLTPDARRLTPQG